MTATPPQFIGKHTFVVLAYKESTHLQECLDSLKSQIMTSEILICTSTPCFFLETVAKKNGLKLVVNPKPEGIASDWNFALDQAVTPYVTLAHQDDIYFPQYSTAMVETAETRRDALIIFSNYNEIIDDGNKVFIREKSLNFRIKNIISSLFFRYGNYLVKNKSWFLAFGNPIGCPTVTFKTDNTRGFKFDCRFSVNIDWKAWHDLAQKKGSFLWVKRPLVSHRIHADSETSRGLAENRRQDEDREMFKKFWFSVLVPLIGRCYSLGYRNNT